MIQWVEKMALCGGGGGVFVELGVICFKRKKKRRGKRSDMI